MKNYNFEILDNSNKNELAEYERKLFNAYSKDQNNWMTNNYIIENNRMRPDIPYHDQIIYVAKNEKDNIVAGMTAHVNSSNKFILERMGFKIEKNNSTIEGLTWFIVEEEFFNFKEINKGLKKILIKDILNRGFKKIYGTTNVKHYSIHKVIFEWKKILDIKKVKKEYRCLMERFYV